MRCLAVGCSHDEGAWRQLALPPRGRSAPSTRRGNMSREGGRTIPPQSKKAPEHGALSRSPPARRAPPTVLPPPRAGFHTHPMCVELAQARKKDIPAHRTRTLISGPLLLLKNPVEGSPAEDSEAEGGTRVVPRPVRSKHERRRQESKAREAPSCVRWCVVSVCGVLWFVCRYACFQPFPPTSAPRWKRRAALLVPGGASSDNHAENFPYGR